MLKLLSQPAKAVWIEIPERGGDSVKKKSQPAKAVWIEIPSTVEITKLLLSHSLRRLCGLKYAVLPKLLELWHVTACEGCVD